MLNAWYRRRKIKNQLNEKCGTKSKLGQDTRKKYVLIQPMKTAMMWHDVWTMT